ncbi:hypothetical protein [Brevundimonas sp. A19_0]|uniref:Bbp19 family protein n=1 Tax=Brevundimonas sp. A19_0 TaxID=2821087 RepID=UPI001ADCDD65|nr:hypothetical protein [Brevundimonas sp. A19_0]MBO9502519.1 hypothetical protein [Brevundimonas sp. A19_0]
MTATPDIEALQRAAIADRVARLDAAQLADIERDYREVFRTDAGRRVLVHQLAEAGVGSLRGPDMTPERGRYQDGRADQALHLLNMAGFGAMSAAMAVAEDMLEGQDNDGHQSSVGRDDGHHGDGRGGGGFSRPDDGAIPD